MRVPLFKVHVSLDVEEEMIRVLRSGYIGQGPEVEKFEKELESWMGLRPLALNSGTSGLSLALHLAGVAPGDEVITTPMTCFATNAPIVTCGATIVWSDIDPDTGLMDWKSVVHRLTPRTQAIVCVDWAGTPCNLEQLLTAAEIVGVSLIEDAAHAFGARFQDRPIGSVADFTVFSFQAIKHLTTVDGGALTCKRSEDRERGKLLRWYGIDREGPRQDLRCETDIPEVGYKFHMNDVAAAMGRVNLRCMNKVLQAHRDNAAFYRQALADLPRVRLLREPEGIVSSYWLFTIRVEDRESFRNHMECAGIQTSQVHTRCDAHTSMENLRSHPLPGVDTFAAEQISIPVGWWVTEDDREYVAEEVRKWSRG